MTAKRVVILVLAVGVGVGLFLQCKKTDPDILARLGDVVGSKVKAALPEASKVAGPLVAFKPGDVLPIEEKVRMRIGMDKKMTGAAVIVAPGPESGAIRLRGVVNHAEQAARAEQLALETVGVQSVVNELARPE
jgi:hypothetical protein